VIGWKQGSWRAMEDCRRTAVFWRRSSHHSVVTVVLTVALAIGGAEAREEGKMRMTSTAFSHEGSIPTVYTCEGRDLSPPLTWSGLPADTKSLALIVDDPDAPDPAAPKMTWVHWVLYNLPPTTEGLPEDARALPPGSREGVNDWKRTGYGGPCPPIGRHRYFHKLYALDVVLPDLKQPTKVQLEQAMKGHVLAETQLMGTYQKVR
jgi:Raf kinase inhibitor-like YbhB/YbcL family protein